MSSLLQLGITGGIGAGKSTVAKIFSLLNIPVYDADTNAKWLMANDKALIEQIIKLFGQESYRPDGSLNREFLARIAFSSEENTKKLNNIVHPAVGSHYRQWVSSQKGAAYVLKEAALLFESQSYRQLDKIITVFAPEEVRIERVVKRDPHRSRKQISDIIKSQMADEKKMQLADFIIYNDDLQLVIPQVIEIDRKLRGVFL